jgi:hypothetical protein
LRFEINNVSFLDETYEIDKLEEYEYGRKSEKFCARHSNRSVGAYGVRADGDIRATKDLATSATRNDDEAAADAFRSGLSEGLRRRLRAG